MQLFVLIWDILLNSCFSQVLPMPQPVHLVLWIQMKVANLLTIVSLVVQATTVQDGVYLNPQDSVGSATIALVMASLMYQDLQSTSVLQGSIVLIRLVILIHVHLVSTIVLWHTILATIALVMVSLMYQDLQSISVRKGGFYCLLHFYQHLCQVSTIYLYVPFLFFWWFDLKKKSRLKKTTTNKQADNLRFNQIWRWRSYIFWKQQDTYSKKKFENKIASPAKDQILHNYIAVF